MKQLCYTIMLAVCLAVTACQSPHLTPGVYAPAGQVADLQLYQADCAYSLAFGTLDSAFKFERDNRAVLWKLSPKIKHALDEIRPQAWAANQRWAVARQAYITQPIPANMTALQTIIAKVQQLTAAAQAALAQTGGN
jgi:hypothetical protein